MDAIKCCTECNEHVEACLATEGLAAIYFRESDYENAIKYYKEALAILTKSDDTNSAHSERIVNKLAEAVQYQMRVKEEGDEVGALTGDGARRYGRRRGKLRYGTVNSLVAKGLEETNDELDEPSSLVDSTDSNDEMDSSSEPRVLDQHGKPPGFYEVSSDDTSERRSKVNEDFVDSRRNYSTHRYDGGNGKFNLLDSGSDDEPDTRRQRKRTREIERAKNSRTCSIQ